MRLFDLITQLHLPKNAKMGVTGSRRGMTARQTIRMMDLVLRLQPKRMCHGCCQGADSDAHDVFYTLNKRLELNGTVYGYPPLEDARVMDNLEKRDMIIHEPMEYLERNHAIVDDTDYLIGFPDTPIELDRSGTWSTIRYAFKKGRPIIVVLPSGSTVTYPFTLTQK